MFTGNELTFGLVLGSWLLWGGLGSLIRPRRSAGPSTGRLAGIYALAVVLFFAGLVAFEVLRSAHGHSSRPS